MKVENVRKGIESKKSDKTRKGRVDAPVLDLHEVEDVGAARDEEYLHEEVVEGHPVPEEVKVARDEHGRV